jgi:hypothetical protein
MSVMTNLYSSKSARETSTPALPDFALPRTSLSVGSIYHPLHARVDVAPVHGADGHAGRDPKKAFDRPCGSRGIFDRSTRRRWAAGVALFHGGQASLWLFG